MYFIDWISLKIYETYITTNNVNFTRYLGQFLEDKMIFEDNIPSSMVSRRGNFYGIQLKAMVEREVPMINFEISKAIYFPNNDTYDVTDIVSGYFIDILHSLEERFNFTTKLYKRKDNKWGYPKTLPNGTVVLDGMLKNLAEGSADFAWAPFGVVPARIPYIDFMLSLIHI